MPLLFWDASALVKRYTEEVGSDMVDAIFAAVPISSMVTTAWGYAETFFILLRKLNDGRLDQPTFAAATASLKSEVIDSPDFGFFGVDDAAVFATLPLMQRHNLNTTDAVLLVVLLRHAQALPVGAPQLVLVAADKRFVRAAEAEGFKTLNPELVPAADLPTVLASL